MKKFFTTLLMLAAMVGMNAQDNIYILGNVGDQTWEPSIGTQMENLGDGTYQYEGHFNASSYFSFTYMLAETAGDWDAIKPYRFGATFNNFSVEDLLEEPIACGELSESSENAFLITKAADYRLTLVDDGEDRLLMVERLSEPDPVVPPVPGGIFVLGGVNGNSWEPSVGVAMDSVANNVFTVNINVADSVSSFSFTRALATTIGDWASISQYRFAAIEGQNEVVLGEALPLSEEGVSEPSFSIAQGYYLLTLDLNARTLTVTEAEKPEGMFIVGNNPFGNWDPASGVEMTQNGEIFTYEAEINGDVWFIFSGTRGSWNDVNALRYGPLEANEDVIIGEEMTTQLSTNTNASYKVSGNGTYIITFDRENLKFKFEAKGAGIKGDVDGSGIVDVDDVNAVINLILNYNQYKDQYPGSADLDNNGIVDVDDVNAIINIILAH